MAFGVGTSVQQNALVFRLDGPLVEHAYEGGSELIG